MIPLSILDLSPVTTATSGAAALRNTLDLAQFADQLGYFRYWLAEHHNAPTVASSAPEIMIGQIASTTRRLRVGSGGVMLRNHAPLLVAERFKTLEAFFPGRIDLGIGRAPGGDPTTSIALGVGTNVTEDDFPKRFEELILLETRDFPEGHPFKSVYAMPVGVPLPPIWLLGSTGYSAEMAARAGTGFAFAHHFGSYDTATALLDYRRSFRPSRWRQQPWAILNVLVVCAETHEQADYLATSYDLNFVFSSRRRYIALASPTDALAYSYTPDDRKRVEECRARMFIGTPETVYHRLTPLIKASQADELMITSIIFDHQARRHSYALMAERFWLPVI